MVRIGLQSLVCYDIQYPSTFLHSILPKVVPHVILAIACCFRPRLHFELELLMIVPSFLVLLVICILVWALLVGEERTVVDLVIFSDALRLDRFESTQNPVSSLQKSVTPVWNRNYSSDWIVLKFKLSHPEPEYPSEKPPVSSRRKSITPVWNRYLVHTHIDWTVLNHPESSEKRHSSLKPVSSTDPH